MKNRLVRVRELLKRELSDILSKDFSFDGALVTVNSVDVTPDLRQGHVFLGILGNSQQKRKVMEKLEKKRGFIQKRMSKRIVLKNTPQLHFRQDDSVERGVRVVALMEQIDEEDAKAASEREDAEKTEPNDASTPES